MKTYAYGFGLAVLVLLLIFCDRGYPDIYRSDDEILVHESYSRLWEDAGSAAADKSAALFRDALRRDPASPYRWSDLGAALLVTGQTDLARYCYSRATGLGPKVTPVLLRAANFFLQIGDTAQALTLMAAVLKETALYDSAIFSYYRRLDLPTDQILRSGIPPERRAAQAYFRSLLVARNQPQLHAVWNWATAHSFADDVMASQYVTYMIAERDLDAAADVWASYLGKRKGAYRASNFLFNGDFEFEPTGAVLDWNIRPSSHVEVERDSQGAYSGAWSLRIRFQGGNESYEGVSQLAIVKPGAYLLRAHVRTEGLAADSGIRLRVFDAENANRLDVSTGPASGSPPWTQVEKSFAVRPPTKILSVQIVNSNSAGGTAWIDAVELSPALER